MAKDERPSEPAGAIFERLKRRAEFQRASRGKRAHADAFTLQGVRRDRDDPAPAAPRAGFTVTKKVGNAVVRNRIRRRLREALRLAAGLEAASDHDYVVVAKREALRRRFEALTEDLRAAFASLARARDAGPRRAPARQGETRRTTTT